MFVAAIRVILSCLSFNRFEIYALIVPMSLDIFETLAFIVVMSLDKLPKQVLRFIILDVDIAPLGIIKVDIDKFVIVPSFDKILMSLYFLIHLNHPIYPYF